MIRSKINQESDSFTTNARAMRALVDELQRTLSKIYKGGDAKSRKRHTERGKLLVRDRIAALIDLNTYFFEFSAFSALRRANEFGILGKELITPSHVISPASFVFSLIVEIRTFFQGILNEFACFELLVHQFGMAVDGSSFVNYPLMNIFRL